MSRWQLYVTRAVAYRLGNWQGNKRETHQDAKSEKTNVITQVMLGWFQEKKKKLYFGVQGAVWAKLDRIGVPVTLSMVHFFVCVFNTDACTKEVEHGLCCHNHHHVHFELSWRCCCIFLMFCRTWAFPGGLADNVDKDWANDSSESQSSIVVKVLD